MFEVIVLTTFGFSATGADRFYDCIEMMLGYRPNVWLKICWKYTSPVIINVSIKAYKYIVRLSK